VEEEMVYHPTLQSTSDLPSEPERTAVEDAQARIVESVMLLARNCPPEILAQKAREELHALRPCLEEALEALEDLKGRRSLTETECSQRYTFKLLLVACLR
jgi:hypothetical protein